MDDIEKLRAELSSAKSTLANIINKQREINELDNQLHQRANALEELYQRQTQLLRENEKELQRKMTQLRTLHKNELKEAVLENGKLQHQLIEVAQKERAAEIGTKWEKINDLGGLNLLEIYFENNIRRVQAIRVEFSNGDLADSGPEHVLEIIEIAYESASDLELHYSNMVNPPIRDVVWSCTKLTESVHNLMLSVKGVFAAVSLMNEVLNATEMRLQFLRSGSFYRRDEDGTSDVLAEGNMKVRSSLNGMSAFFESSGVVGEDVEMSADGIHKDVGRTHKNTPYTQLNLLQGITNLIEQTKLAASSARLNLTVPKSGYFHNNPHILQSCESIIFGVVPFIEFASAYQDGITNSTNVLACEFYWQNIEWTEALICAWREVAVATNVLGHAVNDVSKGFITQELLIVASHEVGVRTDQLIVCIRDLDNFGCLKQRLLDGLVLSEHCERLVEQVEQRKRNLQGELRRERERHLQGELRRERERHLQGELRRERERHLQGELRRERERHLQGELRRERERHLHQGESLLGSLILGTELRESSPNRVFSQVGRNGSGSAVPGCEGINIALNDLNHEMEQTKKAVDFASRFVKNLMNTPRSGHSKKHLHLLQSCEMIFIFLNSLTNCAVECQYEIVSTSIAHPNADEFYRKNITWTEALIHAWKAVGRATNRLNLIVEGVDGGYFTHGLLIYVANVVASLTTQLAAAITVKGRLDSLNHWLLEGLLNKHCGRLVTQVKKVLEKVAVLRAQQALHTLHSPQAMKQAVQQEPKRQATRALRLLKNLQALRVLKNLQVLRALKNLQVLEVLHKPVKHKL